LLPWLWRHRSPWKTWNSSPGAITKDKTKALALAYVDARTVMNRLDRVLGVAGWRGHYQTLGNGAVRCILSIRLGDEWIAKEDVGGLSDQEDEGDRTKAAHSDGLKGAAVKFGVGRYLYSGSLGFGTEVLRERAETSRLPGPAEFAGQDGGQRDFPADAKPGQRHADTHPGRQGLQKMHGGGAIRAGNPAQKERDELADLIRAAKWRPASVMDDLHAVGFSWAMAFLSKQPDARERGEA
jgi:hypothetical protein